MPSQEAQTVRSRAVTTVVALAAAGALALTGCSSSKSGGGSKSSAGGGLGGGGKSSGATNSNKTYKIGFQGALSGDNQQLGINEINSVNLAVKEANAKG